MHVWFNVYKCFSAGLGAIFKMYVGKEQQMWLETNDNYNMWENKMDASSKRILVTKWVGAAWTRFCTQEQAIRRCFVLTGALITLDELMKPIKGIDYTFSATSDPLNVTDAQQDHQGNQNFRIPSLLNPHQISTTPTISVRDLEISN